MMSLLMDNLLRFPKKREVTPVILKEHQKLQDYWMEIRWSQERLREKMTPFQVAQYNQEAREIIRSQVKLVKDE
jgi:hypothetical protein